MLRQMLRLRYWWLTASLALVLNMILLAYWSDRTVSAHAKYIAAAQQAMSPRVALVLGTAPQLGDGRPNVFTGSVYAPPLSYLRLEPFPAF